MWDMCALGSLVCPLIVCGNDWIFKVSLLGYYWRFSGCFFCDVVN